MGGRAKFRGRNSPTPDVNPERGVGERGREDGEEFAQRQLGRHFAVMLPMGYRSGGQSAVAFTFGSCIWFRRRGKSGRDREPTRAGTTARGVISKGQMSRSEGHTGRSERQMHPSENQQRKTEASVRKKIQKTATSPQVNQPQTHNGKKYFTLEIRYSNSPSKLEHNVRYHQHRFIACEKKLIFIDFGARQKEGGCMHTCDSKK